MIDKMIGFIGAGNMGQAMIGGILKSGLANTSQIIASAHSAATLEKLQTTFSIETTLSNEIVAQRSELLFLAVKPNKFGEILPQIVPVVSSNQRRTHRGEIFLRLVGQIRDRPGIAHGRRCRCVRLLPCLCLSVY